MNPIASNPDGVLALVVRESAALNPLIRELRLSPGSSQRLPAFSAGAHVQVQVRLPDGTAEWRQYSLVNMDTQPGATDAPADYLIAVRLEDSGRGGSTFMHGLQPGDTLQVRTPRNDFPLTSSGEVVLVAGGIGVTPMVSMAAELRSRGQPVRMHYAGRERSVMAYLSELQALLGHDLKVHADQEAGQPLDAGGILDACGSSDHLYVCGPKAMLDAMLKAAGERGWARERVHFELFTGAIAAEGDQPFEVQLAQTGKTVSIPADKSILDCLLESGCDVMFDCRRGECGVCAVPVLAGEIDHRDYVLTDREKAAANVIQVCVSRAKGPRLTLDL